MAQAKKEPQIAMRFKPEANVNLTQIGRDDREDKVGYLLQVGQQKVYLTGVQLGIVIALGKLEVSISKPAYHVKVKESKGAPA